MLYLIENLIIAFFTNIKLVFTRAKSNTNPSIFVLVFKKLGTVLALTIATLTLNAFFFLFLNSFFFKNRYLELISFSAILAFFVSHSISFFVNFVGKKEYLKLIDDDLLAIFFKRVAPLFFTILFGGFFINQLNTEQSVVPAIFLILFKIVADSISHIKIHKINRIVIKRI